MPARTSSGLGSPWLTHRSPWWAAKTGTPLRRETTNQLFPWASGWGVAVYEPVRTTKFTGSHKAVAQCIQQRTGGKVQDEGFGEKYVIYDSVKGLEAQGLTHYAITVARTPLTSSPIVPFLMPRPFPNLGCLAERPVPLCSSSLFPSAGQNPGHERTRPYPTYW